MQQQAIPARPANRQLALNQHAQRCWDAGQRHAARQQWNAAAREYQQAVELAPKEALYWLGLAHASLRQGLLAEAERAGRQALLLQAGNAVVCRLLSRTLRDLQRADEAAALFDNFPFPAGAKPDADFLLEQGEALIGARRFGDAIPVFLHALQLNMFNALGHQRLGIAFQSLDRPLDAAICFETAAAVDKTGDVRTLALSQLVHELQRAGEWTNLSGHVGALLKALTEGSDESVRQVVPFSLLSVPAAPAQHLRVARLNSAARAAGVTPLPAATTPRREGRLRIAYLSCDFHNHATALLITQLIELQDRERFEIFLYCHSIEDGSAIQQRLRAGADHWIDVRRTSDADLARRMRADGIDIAIDLKSHTRDTRFEALAFRPTPVQVTFLGFPGTTGADFIDYLIGDRIVTPFAHAAHFSERIAQLPNSYQPNDGKRALPLAPARAELGLPEDAPVLACFNQNAKITPEVADAWGQVLRASPDAVLWLLSWNPVAEANLRQEMALRGVDASRLVFAPVISAEDNLARLQCADLFLDTWPCNAHTTASEALWAGVPVLTVPGATFASRVAASLVAACGQAHFICPSPQSYVDKAIALTQDLPSLRRAQIHLREQRAELALFDSQRYARDFDALLERMWARHEAGLPPDFLPAVVV